MGFSCGFEAVIPKRRVFICGAMYLAHHPIRGERLALYALVSPVVKSLEVSRNALRGQPVVQSPIENRQSKIYDVPGFVSTAAVGTTDAAVGTTAGGATGTAAVTCPLDRA